MNLQGDKRCKHHPPTALIGDGDPSFYYIPVIGIDSGPDYFIADIWCMVLLLLFLRFLCISGKESLDLTLTVVLYRRISFVLSSSFLSYTEAVEPLLAPFRSLAWPGGSSFREGTSAGAALRREVVPGRNCGCMTEENIARAERAAVDMVERRGTPEKDAEETYSTGEESLEKKFRSDRSRWTYWDNLALSHDIRTRGKGKADRSQRMFWNNLVPVVTSAREAKLGRQLGSRVVVGSLEVATTGKKALRGLRVSEGCVGEGGTVERIGAVVD